MAGRRIEWFLVGRVEWPFRETLRSNVAMVNLTRPARQSIGLIAVYPHGNLPQILHVILEDIAEVRRELL
jgi:hypothetical protein